MPATDTPALPAQQEADEAATLLPTILLQRATSGNDFAAASHAVDCVDQLGKHTYTGPAQD